MINLLFMIKSISSLIKLRQTTLIQLKNSLNLVLETYRWLVRYLTKLNNYQPNKKTKYNKPFQIITLTMSQSI